MSKPKTPKPKPPPRPAPPAPQPPMPIEVYHPGARGNPGKPYA